MIKFHCYECYQKISANDETTEKKVSCPQCKSTIHVPHIGYAQFPPDKPMSWSDIALTAGYVLLALSITILTFYTRGFIYGSVVGFCAVWIANDFLKGEKIAKEKWEKERHKIRNFADARNISIYDLDGQFDYVKAKLDAHYAKEQQRVKKEKKRIKQENKLIRKRKKLED